MSRFTLTVQTHSPRPRPVDTTSTTLALLDCDARSSAGAHGRLELLWTELVFTPRPAAGHSDGAGGGVFRCPRSDIREIKVQRGRPLGCTGLLALVLGLDLAAVALILLPGLVVAALVFMGKFILGTAFTPEDALGIPIMMSPFGVILALVVFVRILLLKPPGWVWGAHLLVRTNRDREWFLLKSVGLDRARSALRLFESYRA